MEMIRIQPERNLGEATFKGKRSLPNPNWPCIAGQKLVVEPCRKKTIGNSGA